MPHHASMRLEENIGLARSLVPTSKVRLSNSLSSSQLITRAVLASESAKYLAERSMTRPTNSPNPALTKTSWYKAMLPAHKLLGTLTSTLATVPSAQAHTKRTISSLLVLPAMVSTPDVFSSGITSLATLVSLLMNLQSTWAPAAWQSVEVMLLTQRSSGIVLISKSHLQDHHQPQR